GYEQYEDKWEIMRVTHAPMSKEEEDERDEALAEVNDPLYLMRTDVDAEGDMEVAETTEVAASGDAEMQDAT
ncbi:hypothetical protein MPER_02017, partial [Moniliophthora perniciosa FA553]